MFAKAPGESGKFAESGSGRVESTGGVALERRSAIPRAESFDTYGGLEVLQVVEVDRPAPGPGKVLVRVKAAGINPGEASFRKGMFADRWPATFPSGLGSDF